MASPAIVGFLQPIIRPEVLPFDRVVLVVVPERNRVRSSVVIGGRLPVGVEEDALLDPVGMLDVDRATPEVGSGLSLPPLAVVHAHHAPVLIQEVVAAAISEPGRGFRDVPWIAYRESRKIWG